MNATVADTGAPERARPGEAVEIAPGVHWVGALDPALRTFDIILRTANGTTYNAYLVRGTKGVAIIDTVKAEFADEFFARLEAVARYDEIRVIVLNHLEPDHSGALPELMRRAPQARLYISTRATSMLKALLKPNEDEPSFEYQTVGTGDEVSLGDRTLRFLHTPYLHWPDTQCTYVVEEAVLFSGDVFGCHHCDSRLFNDRCGDFRFAFDDYYAHIMRPFKTHVMEALRLIEPLPLKMVAPTHGPILRDRPRRYLTRYRELSSPRFTEGLGEAQEAHKTLLIFYLSSYGNTARMAEAIRDGAEETAGVRVSLYDLAGGPLQPFVDLIESADALALGSPTINGDAVKPIWDLLSSLAVIDLKGKLGAAFGSYGWTGEAVRMIEERMRGLKLRVPVVGLRIKLIPTGAELEDCRAFGRALGAAMTGANAGQTLEFEDLV
ncbi:MULTISPECIES: FprA family A-type flavoprotein [Thiorhodovibrio]|uniref:FprA family A-type flavoprotein n=1 Tax=Thiorhodovibrio TaxID=61593 RepID=UPI001913B883|nr:MULTISPECIES: FprA family A-type flavoprotein [Thiorhodovibrio]MBK5970480.1 MBL fold metallo-hydrolase [Thiorhodovibrio winogradskyi]WPL11481.1 Type A flavoprotein fprA [Thiorhodovibrio litoralis]